jgi:hypothetical protein
MRAVLRAFLSQPGAILLLLGVGVVVVGAYMDWLLPLSTFMLLLAGLGVAVAVPFSRRLLRFQGFPCSADKGVRFFPETWSIDQTLWMAFHGGVAALAGMGLHSVAAEYLALPGGTSICRIVPPLVGSVVLITVGAILLAACLLRLVWAFPGEGMGFSAAFTIGVEVVGIVIAGLILDGGEIAGRAWFVALATNLWLGAFTSPPPVGGQG